ncbi:MAG: hypothetical protein IJ311_01560 [Elusimicrobiaceae bacterium]|nr:hypothetical protein [Elusimicrobiaceae bacterium]
MENENIQLEGQTEITRFLEKFNQTVPSGEVSFSRPETREDLSVAMKQEKYNQSFEKLEEKIRELEEKFQASAAQNQAIMQELSRTREVVEKQSNKEAFFANITATIANLKESVENLSRAQQTTRVYDPTTAPSRSFDTVPNVSAGEYAALGSYLPESYRSAQQAKLQLERNEKETALADLTKERLAKNQALTDLQTEKNAKEDALLNLASATAAKEKALADLTVAHQEKSEALAALETERQAKNQALAELKQAKTRTEMAVTELKSGYEEKERFITSLRQKASQLKAVNVALDREIKKVQQEKIEALRKSAEQAKEILSLRDALTAAEERFKSFDFEGRIISIKRQYEQKVNTLETQLHEISNTCMKQVEEIEALKAENLKLHKIAEEREQLAALYEAKTRELEALQVSVAQLRSAEDNTNQSRLAAFTRRMQRLQEEHEALSVRLTQAQEALQTVSAEKQTLEENFKTLLSKIEKNDEVIETLKQKIIVLTEENRELKTRSTTHTPRENTPKQVKEPVTVRQPLPSAKTANTLRAAIKTAREPLPEPESAPVEMQNTMRPKVQTEADLPEIRVADPVPQEQLYNGEDFLEKTDSFIGRMKWSIFREDK